MQSKSGPGVKIGDLSVSVGALSCLEAVKYSLDSAERSLRELLVSPKNAASYKAGCEALTPICRIFDIVAPFIAFSVRTYTILFSLLTTVQPEPICAAVVCSIRLIAKVGDYVAACLHVLTVNILFFSVRRSRLSRTRT